jgi:phosphatidyl-myo-inositol dimannoside synthase
MSRQPGRGHGILGLFSGCVATGGIQASGRIAWEAICAPPQRFGPPTRLCYGDSGPPGRARSRSEVHTVRRYGAVLAALRLRRAVRLVVVWHMDLLRLLPFLRLDGARVVLVLQGVEAWRRRPLPERWLLRRVNSFLSISDYTWRRFLQVYPDHAGAHHITVHLGVGQASDCAVQEPDVPPTAVMLGRLARGEDYKGHREMIDAWPLVQRRVPDARLWIVGDGDLRPDLNRMAVSRGVDGSVQFLGFVPEEQKQQLLSRARCMAVPSRGEGFGLVYLEAMRLGRPCLVSTVDAGFEVVQPPRNGLAADPDNREQLAEATSRLLTAGTEWQRWSECARSHYEQYYTAEQYQQRLTAALEAVVES